MGSQRVGHDCATNTHQSSNYWNPFKLFNSKCKDIRCSYFFSESNYILFFLIQIKFNFSLTYQVGGTFSIRTFMGIKKNKQTNKKTNKKTHLQGLPNLENLGNYLQSIEVVAHFSKSDVSRPVAQSI